MFINVVEQINDLIINWEQRLLTLSKNQIENNRNTQDRNIKQIIGHLIDSVSNNTHRIIHLQYQVSPLIYPDYANHGNNDRWIAIQNYENEEWENLVLLWKYTHLHLMHVIKSIDESKLNNVWISALDEEVSLKAMVEDFPRHLQLHLSQIESLIQE